MQIFGFSSKWWPAVALHEYILRGFKCVACFKKFSVKSYLVEHMILRGHSVHDPRCGWCNKYFRCLDALQEHLSGFLGKEECSKQFARRGCSLCLNFFSDPETLESHIEHCRLTSPLAPAACVATIRGDEASDGGSSIRQTAVALDCEMVGGGQDGSFDLCARICVIDEDENVLLHTYVEPQLPITDYRYEITGILPDHLLGAMPIGSVKWIVERILYNGHRNWKNEQSAKLLVGHSVAYDLNCLGIDYPPDLIRDTATYPWYQKTSKASNSLRYLTKTYLGYEIQNGCHTPFEDASAAMRLYKRMKRAYHIPLNTLSLKETQPLLCDMDRRYLEALSPEALFDLSKPHFQCWCMDS